MDQSTTLVNFRNKNLILNILFFLFIAIILLNRVLLFLSINIDFIDSDQPFMWIGASDYAKGLFYEPRFYGQDYNTFMEGLFAVPFIWLGIPIYYALPLATHFIFLFPFLFSSTYLFINEKKENALVVLGILLCMPSGYDILNSIPRGFVTGLFFTSFFVLSFFNPHSLRFVILNTLFVIIGYFVNPNSVIVSVPFSFFIFLNNYKEKNYYLAMFGCALSIYPMHLLFNQFYLDHPNYVVFELVYDFSPANLWKNLCHLDQAFQHVNFFIENRCWTLLLMLSLLFVVLFKSNKLLFWSSLSFILVILVSFFSGKVRDGAVWPYYSFSRMYLGIPIFIALQCSRLNFSKLYLWTPVVVITLLFSGYKLLRFEKNIAYHTQESHWLGVHLVSLKNVKDAAELYNSVCKKHGLDHMIISNGFWLSTYLDYGGPAFYNDFPSTEETNAERRYYVREANKTKVFTQFLYISIDSNLDKKLADRTDFKLERQDDYGMFVVKNNRLRNDAFMALMRETE